MAILKANDEVERREWVGWTRGRVVVSLAGSGAGMTAEVEPSNTCAICKRPILPGSGRYRTEEGDVHEECCQERHGRKSPTAGAPSSGAATASRASRCRTLTAAGGRIDR